MFLLASSVNWADVNDLFRGRVGKTSPRKTEQAQHNKNDSKRFVHNWSHSGCDIFFVALTLSSITTEHF